MVVNVRESSGNFPGSNISFLDWNSPASSFKRDFFAPLLDLKNYAYSYFQVTAIDSLPDMQTLFKPEGLIKSVFSEDSSGDLFLKEGIKAKIDFSTFVPPADKAHPTQYKYYVRAVHVYLNSEKPGYASLLYSPSMSVTYGMQSFSDVISTLSFGRIVDASKICLFMAPGELASQVLHAE